MKTILVTGANGFVGQHLVRELSEHGITVIGVGGPIGATKRSPYVSEYLELDLMKTDDVARLDFKGVDGVVHLAGLAVLGSSFDNPMSYVSVNMGIEINLFEAAIAQNTKPRFLVVSSGTLYDPKASLPLTEDSTVLPNSPYAVSKLGQEQMAQYYVHRGFEAIIARPFNHIGPGQGPGFIVPDLAQQIVACEKQESSLIKVGNLDAQRDYTDVRDIARAYRMLLEKGVSGEIYNICSGEALSGHQILDGLLKNSTAKPEVVQDPDKMRPSDAHIVYGSHDKITRDTDWQPEIAIETSLNDALNVWRQAN